MEKILLKISLQIRAFQVILRALKFFSQILDLDFLGLGLGLDLHHGPLSAYDLPGCQKWSFEAAWAISYWPGPRRQATHPPETKSHPETKSQMRITFHGNLYGKIFLLQILAFQAILSTSIFFYFDFDLDLGLGLDPGLDCELHEVPPATYDPPGCQK